LFEEKYAKAPAILPPNEPDQALAEGNNRITSDAVV